MNKFKKRAELVRQVDFVNRYSDSTNQLETLYGLPPKVTFCKKCVISNQRPNSAVEYKHTADAKKTTIFLDEELVCDACRFAEKKRREIDWTER